MACLSLPFAFGRPGRQPWAWQIVPARHQSRSKFSGAPKPAFRSEGSQRGRGICDTHGAQLDQKSWHRSTHPDSDFVYVDPPLQLCCHLSPTFAPGQPFGTKCNFSRA